MFEGMMDHIRKEREKRRKRRMKQLQFELNLEKQIIDIEYAEAMSKLQDLKRKLSITNWIELNGPLGVTNWLLFTDDLARQAPFRRPKVSDSLILPSLTDFADPELFPRIYTPGEIKKLFPKSPTHFKNYTFME